MKKKPLDNTPVRFIIIALIIFLALIGSYFFDKRLNINSLKELLSFNKKPLPTAAERQLATLVEVPTNQETQEPGFSITPPENWYIANDDESQAKVAFISPENDTIDIDNEIKFTLPASVQVNIAPVDDYYCENIDELVAIHTKTRYNDQGIQNNQPITVGDINGRLIEVVTEIPEYYQNVKMYERIFCKNNYKVVISGLSLENYWEKNSPAIFSSLDSFQLSN